MNPAQNAELYSFSLRWAPGLKRFGHAQISNFFLRFYHRLNPSITHGEAMFVIHLMQHKWDNAAPFPKYETIATRMGVSVKTARRFASNLQGKGYLWREYNIGRPNRFHLDKLMKALVALVPAVEEPKRHRRPGG